GCWRRFQTGQPPGMRRPGWRSSWPGSRRWRSPAGKIDGAGRAGLSSRRLATTTGDRMDPIADILARYPLVVLDGALATELERRGCNLDDPLWSARILIERPELIRAVHADYFAAGADCAITASDQATFAG